MVIYENIRLVSLPVDRKRFAICEPKMEKEWMKYRNPVGAWLEELNTSIEDECLSALQAKSVATTSQAFEALSIRNAQIAIHQIRTVSLEVIDGIDSHIDSLPITCEDLTELKNNFSQIGHKICQVIEMCRRIGCDYNANQQYKTKCSVSVATLCQQMIKFMNDFIVKKKINNAQLEATLRKLKENFGELIDSTIKKECQVITSSLHNNSSHLCLKWALLSYWQLTQNDAYICRIFIESQNVVKRLIDIISNYSSLSLNAQEQLKAAALRVLTYLCINQDAVGQILHECVSGKCFLSFISHETNQIILREAIGLMVQITAPFIDFHKGDFKWNNENLNELNYKHIISDFVITLTDIARSTCSQEIFLLSSAAIANISFMDVDAIIKCDTISILVNACKQRINFDEINLKDQVVTILANVARKDTLEIVSNGGLVFLLCALQFRSTASIKQKQDLIAIERIQQKVCIALARLGNHKSAAKLIYKLNGVERLIELCKDAKERNFSDTVLMASIAALRRIAHNIGRNFFKELDGLDLIDGTFQEAFLMYSSKNESFV